MDAIRAVAPFAAAIAVSPLTLAFVIGLLLSTGAGARMRAFLVVWFATLTAVAVGLLLALPLGEVEATNGGTAETGTNLAIGILLAVLAAVALWRAGRRGRVRPLVQHLERLTPRRTAVVAAVLALNPKNLALVLGGAVAVPFPGPSTVGAMLVGTGFGLIASTPLLLVAPVSASTSPRVELALDRAHVWATAHGDLVAALVLASLATLLIARGAGA